MNPINQKLAIVLAALLPSAALADWTGGYAGLSVGTAITSELSADIEGESESIELDGGAVLGAFAGYQVQSGALAYGGELAFTNGTDFEGEFDGNAASFDFHTIDLKGRAGYAIDDLLLYGVLGVT